MARTLVLTEHFKERAAERALPASVLALTLKSHRRVQDRRNPRVTLLVGAQATVVCSFTPKEQTLLTCWWENDTAEEG